MITATTPPYAPRAQYKEKIKEKEKDTHEDETSKDSSTSNESGAPLSLADETLRQISIQNIDSGLNAFLSTLNPPLLHDIDKAILYFSTPSWDQLIDIQM